MAIDVRIVGLLGTYYLEATTAHTGKRFSMLYIDSDAVFTHLAITNENSSIAVIDGITSQNLAGKTVHQGGILTAPQDSWFSAVTMSSGTAIGVISEI